MIKNRFLRFARLVTTYNRDETAGNDMCSTIVLTRSTRSADAHVCCRGFVARICRAARNPFEGGGPTEKIIIKDMKTQGFPVVYVPHYIRVIKIT